MEDIYFDKFYTSNEITYSYNHSKVLRWDTYKNWRYYWPNAYTGQMSPLGQCLRWANVSTTPMSPLDSGSENFLGPTVQWNDLCQ